MKKILFATLVFCISTATNAQKIATIKKAKHKIGLGMQANMLSCTISNVKLFDDASRNYSSKLGFRAGFILNIPLGNKFAFTPSLNYVNKGTKVTTTSFYGGGIDVTITTSHIEIPLNFTTTFGKNKKIIAGLGPVISYGIRGSVKGTEASGDFTIPTIIPVNATVKFDGSSNYDGNTHYKAVEVGGNIMLGYKFSSKYSLCMVYNRTFTNSTPPQGFSYTGTYKTIYWGLNFGYSFF